MSLSNQTDISNDALLVRFANGDREAAILLTHRLTPRLLGYATRVVSNQADAQDIVQEAMIKLWKIAATWEQGNAKVETWLYTVVTNLCRDQLRRKTTTSIANIEEPIDDHETVDDTIMQNTRLGLLHNAIDTLPERQRQAVILRHVEDLSNPSIAEIMEISVEAVESLISRAKRRLTVILEPQKDILGYSYDRL